MSAVTTSLSPDKLSTSDIPQTGSLPVTRELRLAYALSITIAVLMAFASIAGLLYRQRLYPSDELMLAFPPSDLFNLVIGFPLLLASMIMALRGKLFALLSWPGALFYTLYTYLPYAVGVPFNILFMPYQLLVALTACTLIYLVASIDLQAVSQKVAGRVPARFTGWVLLGLALLIGVRQTALIVGALTGQTPLEPLGTLAWTADFLIAIPILLAVGILIWRRSSLGYAAAPGVLLGYAMLALCLIPYFLWQAASANASLDLDGIAVVLVMAGLCLAPYASFMLAAGLPYRDLNATRIITATVGVIFGLSGVNHGLFESLQGNKSTSGLVIHAIGEAQRFWELGTEDAFTIVPNFLITGILSMLIGFVIVFWSLRGLGRGNGPAIFLGLFVLLFLVGGGIGQIAFFIPAWAFATRIHKPLDWWRKILPQRIRPMLSALWPFTLLLSIVAILIGVEIAIFGYFPGMSDPVVLQNTAMSFVLASAILNILTFIAGIGHDLRRLYL
jgi:hypothetical protein